MKRKSDFSPSWLSMSGQTYTVDGAYRLVPSNDFYRPSFASSDDESAELSRNFLSLGHDIFRSLKAQSRLSPKASTTKISYPTNSSHLTIDLCETFQIPHPIILHLLIHISVASSSSHVNIHENHDPRSPLGPAFV